MKAQTGKTTRRSIIKTVGLATAGAGLLMRASLASTGNKDQRGCCGDQPVPDKSVFTTVCNDKSADKYHHGDNPVVYRLGALWLMLTTENWAEYFRDPKNKTTESAVLAGLAKELKLDQVDVQNLWDISKTKASSFKDIRASWKNFTSNTSRYGARPCHGGRSILNIACLDKS